MQEKSTDYDLVLVFTAFQRNCVYAPIIKELSRQYRIAIFPVDRDAKTQSRIGDTNWKFLELCISLGATVLSDQIVSASIQIMAQSNYSEADVALIRSRISAERTFWMSGVAMGNAFFENLNGKEIDKILVPDLDFYNYRISSYGDDGVHFPASMIVETGMPYQRYPLFPDFAEIDWILANPTPFSFVTAKDRLDYLHNVLHVVRLARECGHTVAFKPHNADERADYIVNSRLNSFFSQKMAKPFIVAADILLRLLRPILPGKQLKTICDEVLVAVSYRRVMDLVVHLKDLTTYHNLNLEIFLPRVKKGLITGRSNSIWHGLIAKKSVINCVDEKKPYFSDSKMHKYAMYYLGVHGNYESLSFSEDLWEKIPDRTRSADLIEFIRKELNLKNTVKS